LLATSIYELHARHFSLTETCTYQAITNQNKP
jgi:hypothetical protein